MKIMLSLLAIVGFLIACSPENSQPKPNPNASTWGNAMWNEGKWQK